jgi:hypothetical protein
LLVVIFKRLFQALKSLGEQEQANGGPSIGTLADREAFAPETLSERWIRIGTGVFGAPMYLEAPPKELRPIILSGRNGRPRRSPRGYDSSPPAPGNGGLARSRS